MGLSPTMKNKRVFLDTAPLIYYIEENQRYSSVLNKLFLDNGKGEFLFQTSVITLLENENLRIDNSMFIIFSTQF